MKSNYLLDDLLQRVGEKLQISKTQRELAEERYHAVSTWLSKDGDLFDGVEINIYPQGSLSIGTTVKPLSRQEYDLDLVCEINESYAGKDPIILLNKIERRLKDNEIYKDKVERKNRCIRLNYANEFYMDILPAHPTNSITDTCVMVPDRKAEEWKDSNPKGFTSWFNNCSNQVGKTLFEARAEIEPLPEDETVERKVPLKRAVQLIKRYRDIYFEKDADLAPISIVLTTLAGHGYEGQLSVNETISHILKHISLLISQSDKRIVVLNPSNNKEDLSERWDNNPELYLEFEKFVMDFKLNWEQLNEIQGLNEIANKLKKMFGENITNQVLKEQAIHLEKSRSNKNLAVIGSGLLVAATTEKAVAMERNTFYGKETDTI
ncbi:nucleotidyltransferase [Bacillus sp. P14.5]|uniref:nucleotidyltransferase domain-containing protein n=1 Tax=Bacillus sp. P14.5 TaxID=1983400 RepID=UPI001F06B38B|nr:nucleotidyltransferase [Bacillus sp. P14.5]